MQIEEHVPLAPLTTWRVGGPARWYARPRNAEDVAAALAFARERGLPVFRLGGGSNVLISDRGIDGLVLHLAGLDSLAFDGALVEAGAGLSVDALADAAAARGLAGLEFSGGLPGSVGGAAYMNARAFERSFSDVVSSVDVVDPDGARRRLLVEELDYSYKHSLLMDGEAIVVLVRLVLEPGDPDAVLAATATSRARRDEGGQYTFPSAGCVFKNDYDVGVPSGKLIDETGLRGLRVGDAAVYDRHANFIVNLGGATARDIRALIERVKREVFEKRGVALEEEVRYFGDWG